MKYSELRLREDCAVRGPDGHLTHTLRDVEVVFDRDSNMLRVGDIEFPAANVVYCKRAPVAPPPTQTTTARRERPPRGA